MPTVIEYFAHHYSLVINNDQGSYNAAREVVAEVTKASDVTVSQYRAMTTSERRIAFASEIGERVLGLIREWCEAITDAHHGSIGQMLIAEIMIYDSGSLSFSGGDLAWALGEDFLPDDGEADEFFNDDETDDDGGE